MSLPIRNSKGASPGYAPFFILIPVIFKETETGEELLDQPDR
jgi:hypothetical protein